MSERFVVAHAIPRYAALDSDAAASAESLAWGWDEHAPPGWILKRHEWQGQPVSHVRNMLAAWALAEQPTPIERRVGNGGGPPADVILWQDTDVSFEPADALTLLDVLARAPADVGAIGCPCLCQSREGEARVNVNCNGFEDSLPLIQRGKCAPVAGVGFGLIACRSSVYRALGDTSHRFSYVAGLHDVVGEDLGWCDEARLAGFSIYAHGGILPWHTFPRRFRIDAESDAWLAASGAKRKES